MEKKIQDLENRLIKLQKTLDILIVSIDNQNNKKKKNIINRIKHYCDLYKFFGKA